MDYTKVISTVKKYAIAIVDEIDTLSSNTTADLDGLFAKIKKETDTIKSDVAGVKSDVAEVKSAIGTASQLADVINGEVI